MLVTCLMFLPDCCLLTSNRWLQAVKSSQMVIILKEPYLSRCGTCNISGSEVHSVAGLRAGSCPSSSPPQHTPRSPATIQTLCTIRSAQDTGLRNSSSLCVQIVVFCKETEGQFLVQQGLFVCLCNACQDKPEADRTFSGTGFEAHCGAAASKKWKVSCCRVLVFTSVCHPNQRPVLPMHPMRTQTDSLMWLQKSLKVLPGQVEEVPEGELSKMPMLPACSLHAGNAVIHGACWPRQAAEMLKALPAGGKPH